MKEQEMWSHTAAEYPGGLLIFKEDCFGMNSRAASRTCRKPLCGYKRQMLLVADRQSDHQAWEDTKAKCKISDPNII